MTFKHKLSRRLASSWATLVTIAFATAACGEETAVTGPEEIVPFDQTIAAALPSSATAGVRVRTLAKVRVWSQSSRFSTVSGSQPRNETGTIVEGPTAVTSREPYPLWRINYVAGPDGWSRGDQLGFVEPTAPTDTAPPPPPPLPAPPAPVATVSVSPSVMSLVVGANATLSATLRDSVGNVLTGRAVAWTSSNSLVASVSSTGVVLALSAGSSTVTATSEGRTGTATITVMTAPPPGIQPPLIWSSDWSTAIGESNSAVGDNGRWDPAWNVDDNVTVVPSEGLGFPSAMANVLAIRYNGTRAHGVIAYRKWQAPVIGETINYRVYWRMSVAPAGSNSQHPLGSGSGQELGAYAFVHRSETTNDFAWWITASNPDFNRIHRWETRLERNVTYRVEWAITRTGTTTYRWEVRIYDPAGQLVRVPADLRCNWSGHNHTLAESPEVEVSDAIAAAYGNMTISHQGNWQVPASLGNRIYYGGVAVSKGGWIGPYIPGEGR